MKPRLPKFNYPLIAGWLFILSIPAIPIAWLFFNSTVLLWSLVFFSVMTIYHVLESFYAEYKIRREAILKFEELQSATQEELSRLLKSDNARLRTEMQFLRKQLREMYHAPMFKTARLQELISRINTALND